jgi:casein kinase II subunit alpha
VLGTEEFDKYMEKYDIEMETDSDALLRACVRKFSRPDCRLTLYVRWPRQPWTRYTTPDTLPFFTPEAIDLLEKLLRYDHQERLTAREAQAHAYFSKPSPIHFFFSHQFYVSDLDVVRLEATGNPGDCVSDSGFYST